MREQAEYRPGESLQIEAARNGFVVYTNGGNFVATSMDEVSALVMMYLTTAGDLGLSENFDTIPSTEAAA